MTNALELKPCPFCGEKASGPHTRSYRRAISCKNCDASAYAETNADAIAGWNRRSVNALPEVVKALAGAKVVIGMMERPDGLGADVSSALDRRIAQIDAALSSLKAEG